MGGLGPAEGGGVCRNFRQQGVLADTPLAIPNYNFLSFYSNQMNKDQLTYSMDIIRNILRAKRLIEI